MRPPAMLVLLFYLGLGAFLFIFCLAVARCCTWVFSPIMQTPIAYHLRHPSKPSELLR